jgi:glutamate-1-semialdehyde 2,1-aminomutase/spore coat polysaccharide biosynthesis protein SpsF
MTAIPGGTSTYSKVRFPGPVRRAAWGNGCWIACDNGKGYVDTVAGLGCISIGYHDKRVDAAIKKQMEYGISFSLPTGFEEFVAQHLLRFLHWGERVRFSKNGADVTNLAVRLARAHTGRDGIVAMDYHGHDDWCQIQSLDQNAGIPKVIGGIVDQRLPPAIADIAAVILEPVPSDGSTRTTEDLKEIATWAKDRGALLIYDCMITGMRLNRRGWPDDAPEPDLACYGKAMGNGMPLSALVGSAELMDRITDDVFFSTTFGGECLSLAAADAVLTVYEEENVIKQLKLAGVRLSAALTIKARKLGLHDQISFASYAARPFHKWRTKEQADTFTETMLDEGILYQGYHNLMLATCEDEPLTLIERAYDVALGKVAAL